MKYPQYLQYFFSIFVISVLAVSCNRPLSANNNILVKMGNKILYRSVLEENIPAGLAKEDSTLAAERFIRSWINDNLLYNIALKNFNDKDKIDRLVEDYRKSLLIYQYEEQLINEKLTGEIDEQSLYDYFNQNKDVLKLERPLARGLFIKVPVNTPQLSNIRMWYKSTSSTSRENLEKFSLNSGAVLDYFVDRWVDYNNLMDNFPKDLLTKADLTAQKKTIEKQDSDYFYFLNITDCLLTGDNAPYEYAKTTIQEILINQRKLDFLKKTQDDLYQRAIDKGEIQFFNE